MSRKTLSQIARKDIAETPYPIWNRLLTLTSAKNQDSTTWNDSRSYTTCLESFCITNTMNDVNIGKKKTFQSFYACCHELINVAFIFTTLLTESQNRSHMSLNSIILLKWLTDYRILTKRFCHGIFADTYFDICDEKTMMKRRDVLMYINNAFYK